jgi:hypothetical protein
MDLRAGGGTGTPCSAFCAGDFIDDAPLHVAIRASRDEILRLVQGP